MDNKTITIEKCRSKFLANMSHAIRTPPNGLLTNLSLKRDNTLNHKQDTYIRNMKTSARLLHSHFSDVLDITQYH
jgi:signal transduction histidine kinase